MARIPSQTNWSAPGVAIREIDVMLARGAVTEGEYRWALRAVREVLRVNENNIAALRSTVEQVIAKLEQAEGRPSPPVPHPGLE